MKGLQFYIFLTISILLYSETLEAKSSKYRLMFRDDPSTTVCIGWDQESGENPIVHYGPTDKSASVSEYPLMKKPDRKVQYQKMNNHFVRLTGLKPDTKYYFVIKDSEGVSKRFWFETLPADPSKKLSIITGGDSRRTRLGNKSWTPRVETNRMVSKLKAHFVAFGGDFTFLDNPKQWQMWFDDWQQTIDSSGRITPLVVARGNHEQDNLSVYNLFDVPNEIISYALNFGGNLMRFYTLNSLAPVVNSTQTKWFAQELENTKNQFTWNFVQYHYPILPHSSHKKVKTDQYIHWAPLFYKYNVQLVVECDAHVTKVTWPIIPDSEGNHGFKRDDKEGTVYVGEGSWGLKRKSDVNYSWTRATGSFHQFKWIILSKEKAVIRTVITEDVSQVQEVDINNRFEAPSGIHLWKIDGADEFILNP